MRTKPAISTGYGIMSDVIMKMKGPTSMYHTKGKSKIYKVWHKGKRVLESMDEEEALLKYQELTETTQ